MDDLRELGVNRLLARIQPPWDQERHERVFAEILGRIRQEQRRGGKRMAPAGRRRFQLSHVVR